MRNTIQLLSFVMILSLCASTCFAAKTTKPNLLIIHTDEHHVNTLGCYGSKMVKTPNIDRLAKDGVLCTSFYATTPVCSPSRGSFVSGLYPQNTPVVQNNIPLADDIVTFAEILQKQGYATGYAGKWHLDGGGKPQWEPERKFGFADTRYMFNRGHWKKLDLFKAEGSKELAPRVAARDKKGPSYAVDGADEKTFATDWLCDRTIDFIRENKDKPFCYMVSIPDPHGPNSVRAPYNTMYDNVEPPLPMAFNPTADQIPAWGQPESKGKKKNKGKVADPTKVSESLRNLLRQYYGMVKCIDDNVGKILNTLDELKLTENTIVVFTSDHSDLCGEHGRHNKGVPFENSAKVAFVISWPAKLPKGLVVNEALGTVDFAPTILDLMGCDVPKDMEGRDAAKLFLGEKPKDWEDLTVVRATGESKWIAVVSDRYKLVYSSIDKPWFYDLEKEPEELTNRYAVPEYQATIKKMKAFLLDYAKRCKDDRVAAMQGI